MKTTDTSVEHPRGNAGKHAIEPLRQNVRESLGILRDRVGSTRRALEERTRGAVSATDGYVHAHPWLVIGAVGAIGVLAGLVLSRRPARSSRSGASP